MKLRDYIVIGGVLLLVYKAGEMAGRIGKITVNIIKNLESEKGE